ncbi:hypothetical protein H696_05839 [Fonticula alba]|uniref:EGF-like domain-containing protein n=1 Tax=Fonticula alba TaxID=691883 RepID=A0A058Z0E5_FONAL|nr:hypothetical protein H696_05839 [Fonticula alba]KCV67730.1 hypothetical protein H696_05839 [Fonticula alba]|eukprot:XP_009497914.1 hypothetical protein H696_05839 [Fonticula alba]
MRPLPRAVAGLLPALGLLVASLLWAPPPPVAAINAEVLALGNVAPRIIRKPPVDAPILLPRYDDPQEGDWPCANPHMKSICVVPHAPCRRASPTSMYNSLFCEECEPGYALIKGRCMPIAFQYANTTITEDARVLPRCQDDRHCSDCRKDATKCDFCWTRRLDSGRCADHDTATWTGCVPAHENIMPECAACTEGFLLDSHRACTRQCAPGEFRCGQHCLPREALPSEGFACDRWPMATFAHSESNILRTPGDWALLKCSIPPPAPGAGAGGSHFEAPEPACFKCHGSCSECVGPRATDCLSCAGPKDRLVPMAEKYFFETRVQVGRCQAEACPVGTVQQTKTSTCQHCPKDCLRCSPDDPNVCMECIPRRFLSLDGRCLEACPPWQAPTPEGKCTSCAGDCRTCLLNFPDMCTSCHPGTYLQFGRCKPFCPKGSVASGDGCFGCPAMCDTCNGATCTRCRPGFALSNGICMDACPTGEFYDEASNACRRCEAPCRTCRYRADFCLSCNAGAGYIHEFQGRCMLECNIADGYSKDIFSNCVDCTVPNCTHCKDHNECTYCTNGHFAHKGKCVAQCPYDHYGTPNGQCLPCSDNCVCRDRVDNCVACRRAFDRLAPNFDNEGRPMCVSQCEAVPGTADFQGRCVACPAECRKCRVTADDEGRPVLDADGHPQFECTACQLGHHLSETGHCVPYPCPDGMYRLRGEICLPCHESCSGQCTGPSPGHCLSHGEDSSSSHASSSHASSVDDSSSHASGSHASSSHHDSSSHASSVDDSSSHASSSHASSSHASSSHTSSSQDSSSQDSSSHASSSHDSSSHTSSSHDSSSHDSSSHDSSSHDSSSHDSSSHDSSSSSSHDSSSHDSSSHDSSSHDSSSHHASSSHASSSHASSSHHDSSSHASSSHSDHSSSPSSSDAGSSSPGSASSGKGDSSSSHGSGSFSDIICTSCIVDALADIRDVLRDLLAYFKASKA